MDRHPRQKSRQSNRFLRPQDLDGHRSARAWSATEVFAEGQWQSLRVHLETRGWNTRQIEQIHDQLRQGWPLALAENNVSVLTGYCPIKARQI
jgi:hypothetical protein